MAAYIALIRKEDGTSYGVEFPDFPGCISAGVTLDEALRGAREALEMHIDGMIDDGQNIPAPSPLDKIVADPEHAGALAILVEGPAERAVRVNVTIEESLLARIDRFVAESNFPGGRSGLLAQAARAAIGDAGARLVPVGRKETIAMAITNKISSATKPFPIGRDSKTREFIPVKEAERRPMTTIVERMPKAAYEGVKKKKN